MGKTVKQTPFEAHEEFAKEHLDVVRRLPFDIRETGAETELAIAKNTANQMDVLLGQPSIQATKILDDADNLLIEDNTDKND